MNFNEEIEIICNNLDFTKGRLFKSNVTDREMWLEVVKETEEELKKQEVFE